MAKYGLVIWDFNGTVIDDTQISIDSINTVLGRRALPQLSGKVAFQDIFTFPVEEYYRRLGFDFSKEPYSVPADEWVELYNAKKFQAPLNEGVYETLAAVTEAGVRQIILSASEKALLYEQLKYLGVSEFFDEILGCGDVYAAGKLELARRWAKGKSAEEIKKTLFIGDTDHDFLCAENIGCDCVLYSGGFMSRGRLEALGAPVIDSISEVCSYIF